MSKPLIKDYLTINTVLDHATQEERQKILDWFDRTARSLVKDQAKGEDSWEGISPGDYYSWLKLAEGEWGKSKRERPASGNPDRPKLVLLQGGLK